MKPKQKAQELVFKMFAEWMQIPYEAVSYHLRIPAYTLGLEWNMTKHCALIAVDEILSFIEDDRESFSWKTYYQELKQEIEKL